MDINKQIKVTQAHYDELKNANKLVDGLSYFIIDTTETVIIDGTDELSSVNLNKFIAKPVLDREYKVDDHIIFEGVEYGALSDTTWTGTLNENWEVITSKTEVKQVIGSINSIAYTPDYIAPNGYLLLDGHVLTTEEKLKYPLCKYNVGETLPDTRGYFHDIIKNFNGDGYSYTKYSDGRLKYNFNAMMQGYTKTFEVPFTTFKSRITTIGNTSYESIYTQSVTARDWGVGINKTGITSINTPVTEWGMTVCIEGLWTDDQPAFNKCDIEYVGDVSIVIPEGAYYKIEELPIDQIKTGAIRLDGTPLTDTEKEILPEAYKDGDNKVDTRGYVLDIIEEVSNSFGTSTRYSDGKMLFKSVMRAGVYNTTFPIAFIDNTYRILHFNGRNSPTGYDYEMPLAFPGGASGQEYAGILRNLTPSGCNVDVMAGMHAEVLVQGKWTNDTPAFETVKWYVPTESSDTGNTYTITQSLEPIGSTRDIFYQNDYIAPTGWLILKGQTFTEADKLRYPLCKYEVGDVLPNTITTDAIPKATIEYVGDATIIAPISAYGEYKEVNINQTVGNGIKLDGSLATAEERTVLPDFCLVDGYKIDTRGYVNHIIETETNSSGISTRYSDGTQDFVFYDKGSGVITMPLPFANTNYSPEYYNGYSGPDWDMQLDYNNGAGYFGILREKTTTGFRLDQGAVPVSKGKLVGVWTETKPEYEIVKWYVPNDGSISPFSTINPDDYVLKTTYDAGMLTKQDVLTAGTHVEITPDNTINVKTGDNDIDLPTISKVKSLINSSTYDIATDTTTGVVKGGGNVDISDTGELNTDLSNYDTKDEVNSKIATATTGLMSESQVNVKIAEATADFISEDAIDNKITTATTGLASEITVDSKIAAATSGLITGTEVDSKINTATADLTTNAEVDSKINTAVFGLASDISVDNKLLSKQDKLVNGIHTVITNSNKVDVVTGTDDTSIPTVSTVKSLIPERRTVFTAVDETALNALTGMQEGDTCIVGTASPYEYFVYTTDSTGIPSWKNVGTADVDLSNYYTKTEVDAIEDTINNNIGTLDAKVESKQGKLFEGDHIDIPSTNVISVLTGTNDNDIPLNSYVKTLVNNSKASIATTTTPGLVRGGGNVTVDSAGDMNFDDSDLVNNAELSSAISNATSTLATKAELTSGLNSKQNTLTKGNHINISGNEISVTTGTSTTDIATVGTVRSEIAGVRRQYFIRATEAEMDAITTMKEGDVCLVGSAEPYDYFMYVNKSGTASWNQVGISEVDLSDYYNKSAVDGMINPINSNISSLQTQVNGKQNAFNLGSNLALNTSTNTMYVVVGTGSNDIPNNAYVNSLIAAIEPPLYTDILVSEASPTGYTRMTGQVLTATAQANPRVPAEYKTKGKYPNYTWEYYSSDFSALFQYVRCIYTGETI